MDLSKLIHLEDFLFNTTSLGHLRVGSITLDSMRKLDIKRTKEMNDEDFVRSLILATAYHSLPESDSYGAELTEDEVKTLPPDDLDRFAQEFLNQRKSLFKDFEDEPKTGPKVVSSTSISKVQKNIDLPREEGENIKKYLRRVLNSHLERHTKHAERIFQNLLPKHLFSDSASRLLEENRKIGNALQDALRVTSALEENKKYGNALQEALRATSATDDIRKAMGHRVDSGVFERAIPAPNIINHPENPILQTNRELKAVADNFDKLMPIIINSGQLIKNMNDLALTMAGSSATHAARTSRQNQLMILIGVISLAVSAWISYLGYVRDGTGDRERTEVSKKLVDTLESSKKASETLSSTVGSALNEMAESQKALAKALQSKNDAGKKK
jgi:hypothetical protein